MPECGLSADGSCPGMASNLKLIIKTAKNVNKESNPTISAKHSLDPKIIEKLHFKLC